MAGAIGNIVGSLIGADATRSAVNTQADATNRALDIQQGQADRAYADQAPYRQAGVNALTQYAGELGTMPTAAEVMAQPGYQFGQQQGQQRLDRQFAAAGGRISGASMKAGARYATDYATTGYNAEYQRRQDRLNRLAALAGLGQTATGASAASGQQAANNMTGLISSQGDATAGARMLNGNTWGNTANAIGAYWQRYGSPWGGGQYGGMTPDMTGSSSFGDASRQSLGLG
jgi:hypothetical protein